jgi:uncharacterized protein
MLLLKPNCECCESDLPPDTEGAFICSFECTYCATYAEQTLALICPNCGGGLFVRPPRPTHLLKSYPASQDRAPVRDGGCKSVH